MGNLGAPSSGPLWAPGASQAFVPFLPPTSRDSYYLHATSIWEGRENHGDVGKIKQERARQREARGADREG